MLCFETTPCCACAYVQLSVTVHVHVYVILRTTHQDFEEIHRTLKVEM